MFLRGADLTEPSLPMTERGLETSVAKHDGSLRAKTKALGPVRQRLDAPNPLQAEEVSAAMRVGDEIGPLVALRDEQAHGNRAPSSER